MVGITDFEKLLFLCKKEGQEYDTWSIDHRFQSLQFYP